MKSDLAKELARIVKTPEGVPDEANYLRPDEDAPEGFSVVEGPGGGRYAVSGGEDAEEGAETPQNGFESIPDDADLVETEYGVVPDTDGPIPPDMRQEPIGSDVHPVLWKRPDGEGELDEYIDEIQDTEWYGEGSQIFDAAFNGDENTENTYTDEDGNYTDERLEQHDEWTEELLDEDAAAPEGEEPIGMVLLGPPGAGKGWWQEQAEEGSFGETGEFVDRQFTHISSDDTKEPIPEYEGTNAAEVHDEASKMAKEDLAPKATEREHNMVVDKVATTPDSTLDMIDNMEEQGYDIRASFVDVPTDKAVHNAVSRYFEAGRFTPLSFVRDAVDKSRNSFDEVIEEAGIPEEKVGRFDNDVEWGDAPDVEEMGEELLKFYREFFGFTKEVGTYKTIDEVERDGKTHGRKTRPRRDERGDRGVDGAGLRGGAGGGDGASRSRGRRKRVEDLDWTSPIGGTRILSRVSTEAVEDAESVVERIGVSNVRQVPEDTLAKSDGPDSLYYERERNAVPDSWKQLADRVPKSLTENHDVVESKLTETYKRQIWPDDLTKAPRTWDGDDDVDKTLKEWVAEVVKEKDPINDQYSGVPALASMKIKQVIERSLTQPQGWSIGSVAKNVQDEFDWMGKRQAQSIARQEVAAVLNTSKYVMNKAAEPVDETWLYRWIGPDDGDTTEICRAIKAEVEKRGGSVPFEVLQDILRQKAREYDEKGGLPARVEELVPHFGCRHTIERAT